MSRLCTHGLINPAQKALTVISPGGGVSLNLEIYICKFIDFFQPHLKLFLQRLYGRGKRALARDEREGSRASHALHGGEIDAGERCGEAGEAGAPARG